MPGRVVIVGTTAKRLLNVNADRLQYEIQNLDESVEIYMNTNNDVSTTNGSRLDPLELESATKLFDPGKVRGPIYAIAASNVNVYIDEWEGKITIRPVG